MSQTDIHTHIHSFTEFNISGTMSVCMKVKITWQFFNVFMGWMQDSKTTCNMHAAPEQTSNNYRHKWNLRIFKDSTYFKSSKIEFPRWINKAYHCLILKILHSYTALRSTFRVCVLGHVQFSVTPSKFNIQKTKIMASSPITSWKIDGETVETVADFISLGSKITADGDCSHEIKRRLLLGRKVMTNLDSILRSRETLLCQQRSI